MRGTPKTQCKHCRKFKVMKLRGLCNLCYITPGVKLNYPRVTGQAWSPVEKARLRQLIAQNVPRKQCAKLLNRGYGATCRVLQRMGLAACKKRKGGERADVQVKKFWRADRTDTMIAFWLDIPRSTVHRHRTALRLPRGNSKLPKEPNGTPAR